MAKTYNDLSQWPQWLHLKRPQAIKVGNRMFICLSIFLSFSISWWLWPLSQLSWDKRQDTPWSPLYYRTKPERQITIFAQFHTYGKFIITSQPNIHIFDIHGLWGEARWEDTQTPKRNTLARKSI